MQIMNQTYNENVISFEASENMEQENKMTIEEASVNFGCVKKELEEEFEFAENQYKVALTYENIFGETSKEQRNNLDSLIGFLDDDIIMKSETGTIKLEDVKEENENVMWRNMELFQFEIIQCHCCRVLFEKREHLEDHMLNCLENYNRLSDNLPGFRPTNTNEEDTVRGSDEISPSIDVDASHSMPSIEIIDSKRSHRKDNFHGDHIGTTDSYTSECSYQTSYKCNLKKHLNTHTDIKPYECDIYKKGFTQKLHIRNHHSNTNEKQYKCSECCYQTYLKGNLNNHLNTHKDIKAFECDICKKRFKRKHSLKYHVRNHHSNTREKEYKCSECPYQTNVKSSLNRHFNTRKDIKSFECDICKKRFTQNDSLKQHIQIKHSNTHNDIKGFECDICKKSFNYKSNLQKHIRNHHSNISEKEHKCSECCYQTYFKGNLNNHLNTHKNIKLFECDICRKIFNHKSSLKYHVRNHHANTNEMEYKCSECPYQTNVKGSLNRHFNTHTDIKSFECDTCKKGFNQKSSLKLHIRNHHSNTSEKDYKCPECPYQTNEKCNLNNHLNTHSNIKPFECDICKKGFTQKRGLKHHVRNHHSNTGEKEYKCSECSYQTDLEGNLNRHLNTHTDIKAFECDICKKRFTQKSNLFKHVRNQHSNTNEKEYKCSECLYQTNRKDNLKQHLNTHKDIKPFECGICKKGFTQKRSVKRHIRNQHSNSSE